jgi:5-methylthioadenosine/S-adenosylhomocysteine deaminase
LLKAAAGVAAGTALPAAASAQSGQGADPDLARLQSHRRILLKGGVVLSMDPQVGNFANADVLIEAGKIRDVRPGIAAADAATVDASYRIVIPGFTDTHSHSSQGILHSCRMAGSIPTTTATSSAGSRRPIRRRMPISACWPPRSA